MSFINTKSLGLYAPKSNESEALKAQASKALNEMLFTYKQLFFGLKHIAWKYRDKSAVFREAYQAGELRRFEVAPGSRGEDGKYTRSEWDMDGLNAYLWHRFSERFDETFNLEAVESLKSQKDIAVATRELLEVALENWGQHLIGDKQEFVKPAEPITDKVRNYEVEIPIKILVAGKHDPETFNVKLIATFLANVRHISLICNGCPQVTIKQERGELSWKGGIQIDPSDKMSSKNAMKLAELLNLAAKINVGIKEFMENPDLFLGLEDAAAHNRNLQRVKAKLLEINKDNYERRKTEKQQHEEQLGNREVAAPVTTTHIVQPKPKTETVRIKQYDSQGNLVSVKPATPMRKAMQKAAEDWLKQHPEFAEDPDAKMGLVAVDAKKLALAADNELPL